MGVVAHYLDTILVPLSLFITIGYHAFLWHNFKNKPLLTTMGIDTLKRRAWLQEIFNKGDDKMAMLAVQSLRNTLMATIFTATISIIIALSIGALTNNALKANQLFNSNFFGSQSSPILILKFGSTTLFLLASFLCSSIGLSCLIDANFLINAAGEFSFSTHAQRIFERGFLWAVVANRVLCIAFPLLMWLFGPVAVALSSVALVWGLYGLDFVTLN